MKTNVNEPLPASGLFSFQTPRVDAFLANTSCKRGANVTDNFTKKELADFARKLERELGAAMEAARLYRGCIHHMATCDVEDAAIARADAMLRNAGHLARKPAPSDSDS